MTLIHDDLRRHVHRWYGKYSGEVVGNEDEQKRGRIKVKVPAILGEKAEAWARPCVPYGHFFIPPVGAKVWIEFEGGDQRYPIWVGTWYPKDGDPAKGGLPKTADKKPPDSRVIHTPSGHEIELTDKKDEEQIVVKHKGGSKVTIAKDDKITIKHKDDATIEIEGSKIVVKNKDGATVELDGSKAKIKADTILLDGSTIKLGGDGASDKVILGDKFDSIIWKMLSTHTHPSAMGPTGPSAQLAPLTLDACLSSTVKTK
jgi:uncharacterized protein involved in type VI secretion and phage assembly